MTSLLYLTLNGCACASLVLWQQQSINRVRREMAQVSDAIVGLRHANATLESTLARDQSRLRQAEATAQAAETELTLAQTPEALLPTPDQEGWWPEDRPYFYLPKALLPKVRFRDHRMSAQELLDQLKASTDGQELPAEVEAQLASAAEAVHSIPYGLFQDNELHPHMAILLGLNESERLAVNELYAGLLDDVRQVEIARLHQVSPPEALDDGRRIAARMPVLSMDVEPLVEATQARLEQTLGLTRAGILKEQASRFYNENLDGLGSVQREFLVSDDGNLYVRYVDQWGNRYFRNRSYNLEECNSASQEAWDYGHLFGPGAPLDLQ